MYSKLVFTPLSYIGWGSINQLLSEVQKYKAKKILIVTDPVLQEIGLVDQITKQLPHQDLIIHIYSDIIPEPPLEVGEKLVAHTKAEN